MRKYFEGGYVQQCKISNDNVRWRLLTVTATKAGNINHNSSFTNSLTEDSLTISFGGYTPNYKSLVRNMQIGFSLMIGQ